MTSTDKAIQIYTARSKGYLRFVNALAYPQGVRAYWKKSEHLKSGLTVLDAGCGTGIAALALIEAMDARGLKPGKLRCFDITPKMLAIFREKLHKDAIEGVEVLQADALNLDTLPVDWENFDLIMSAAMMEYLPRQHLVGALSELRSRLSGTGRVVLFITRKNWLMKLLIAKWWEANCYQKSELTDYFREAGFSKITFGRFPFPYKHLSVWGYIVEAV